MNALRVLEIFCGSFYLIFGMDGFLKKIKLPMPSEKALKFLQALEETKYILFSIKIIEILVGLSWIFSIYPGLGWIVMTPIWFNILAYHLVLNRREMVLPLFLVMSHLALGFKNWEYLVRLFES